MSTKTSIEQKDYVCSRCGTVAATVERIRHFNDEGHDLTADRELIGKVIDYGRCQVARDAVIPGRPNLNELQGCPAFNEL